MRIVFIGPPGVGKGTQCRQLSQHLALPHISSGEMLRSADDTSPLGKLIASYIDRGNLAPDELVMEIVSQRLREPDCVHGYLIDGFPRTLPQARMLDAFLDHRGQALDHVVSLVAAEETLVARLLKRARIEHRVDDTPETIEARLRVFLEQTAPVSEHYRDQGVLREIDATDSPDGVFAAILNRLGV